MPTAASKTQKFTLGNPLESAISYGKVKMSMPTSSSTSSPISTNDMFKILNDKYHLSTSVLNVVYGEEGKYMTVPKPVSALTITSNSPMYVNLNKLKTTTTDLISDDITMQIMGNMEKALQQATNSYELFLKEVAKNPPPASNQNGIPLFENESNRTSYLGDTMKAVYNTYYNDGSDISIYDIYDTSNPNLAQLSSFNALQVEFTSRMGQLEYDSGTIGIYPLLTNAERDFIRNGHTKGYYGAEFLTEMIQNSLLSEVGNFDTPQLSCGFYIVHDINDVDTVINIRFYCSYVFRPMLNIGGTSSTNHPVAISSGFNLFDMIDMTQFEIGASSTNFITLMDNVCSTLNGDKIVGFTTSDTKWEFGPNNVFNTLKCISAPNAKYWENQYIKNCFLQGSDVNIPRRMRRIMEYINASYATLFNKQLIVFPYSDGSAKIIAIINVIKDATGKITIQNKEARVDTMFPVNQVNSDMIINGELQVQNYQGNSLLLVDPATTSVSIMGKLGVNQPLHDVEAMVDINNLSTRNMKEFIDELSPLLLNTIENMDKTITTNPYDPNTSVALQTSSTSMQLKLGIYNTTPVPSTQTRAQRFALLQARIELPFRMSTIIAAYQTRFGITKGIAQLTNNAKEYLSEYNKKKAQEEEDAVLNSILNVCGKLALSAAADLTDGASSMILKGVSDIMEIAGLKPPLEYLKVSTSGMSSKQIHTLYENTLNTLSIQQTALAKENDTIKTLKEVLGYQAGILGLGDLYDTYLTEETDVTYALRLEILYKQMHDKIQSDHYISITLTVGEFLDCMDPAISTQPTISADPSGFYYNFFPQSLKLMFMDTDMTSTVTALKTSATYNASGSATDQLKTYRSSVMTVLTVTTANVNNATGSLNTQAVFVHPSDYMATFSTDQVGIDAKTSLITFHTFWKDALTWILDNYGNETSSNGYNSVGTASNRWMIHYVDSWRAAAQAEFPIRQFDDKTWPGWGETPNNWGYGDVIGYLYNYFSWEHTSIRYISQRVTNGVPALILPHTNMLTTLNSDITTLQKQENELQDDLAYYTSNQGWDAVTHNSLKKIISNMYKMYQLHGTRMVDTVQTFASILPVTDSSNLVTSVLYMKMSLVLSNPGSEPYLNMSGRSLSVDQYTRDVSYRETLLQFVSKLTSASQFVNYGVVLFDGSANAPTIPEKIKSDGIFVGRFGDGTLQLVVEDFTDSDDVIMIDNETNTQWNGKHTNTLVYPGTSVIVADDNTILMERFKEQYKFDPLAKNVPYNKLYRGDLFAVTYKHLSDWNICVMRFTDIGDKTYRITCNVSVPDFISQSIITRGDSTMYGDFTVSSSDAQPIFHVDTLNNMTLCSRPLGISCNPTTMLEVKDTALTDIVRTVDAISSQMNNTNGVIDDIIELLYALPSTRPTKWFNADETEWKVSDLVDQIVQVTDSSTNMPIDYYFGTYSDTDTETTIIFASNSTDIKKHISDLDTTSAGYDPLVISGFTTETWTALPDIDTSVSPHFLFVDMVVPPTYGEIQTKIGSKPMPQTVYSYVVGSTVPGDTLVTHDAYHPTWNGNTLQSVIDNNSAIVNASITKYTIPYMNTLMQSTLHYTGGVNTYVDEDIFGETFSILRSIIPGNPADNSSTVHAKFVSDIQSQQQESMLAEYHCWNEIVTSESSGAILTNENIKEAVNAWIDNPITATATYGHISVWNTTAVTNMRLLFQQCETFNDDISKWDVSNVTNMSNVFDQATAFNQPIGNWNVSKVTNMNGMFYYAKSFNQPIGNWDVSNVTGMEQMFWVAEKFNQDITTWKTTSVINFNNMINSDSTTGILGAPLTPTQAYFNHYSYSYIVHVPNTIPQYEDLVSFTLTNKTIKDAVAAWIADPTTATATYGHISDWITTGVTDMSYLFYQSGALPYVVFNEDISNWDVSNVTRMNHMFFNAYYFNYPIGSWNVSAVTDMNNMFFQAEAYNHPLDQWDVSNVTNMYNMFNWVTVFNQDITTWRTTNVTNFTTMFHIPGKMVKERGAAQTPTQAYFNHGTTNVPPTTTVSTLEAKLSEDVYNYITAIDAIIPVVSTIVTNPAATTTTAITDANIKDTVTAWCDTSTRSATETTYGHISDWDTSSVTNMFELFIYKETFNEDLSRWDVSNVTNMEWLFYDAKAFNQPIDNWDVSKVTNMKGMFQNAQVFNQPLGNWNVHSVTNMHNMFWEAIAFDQDITNWRIIISTIILTNMFHAATAMIAAGAPVTPTSAYFNQLTGAAATAANTAAAAANITPKMMNIIYAGEVAARNNYQITAAFPDPSDVAIIATWRHVFAIT